MNPLATEPQAPVGMVPRRTSPRGRLGPYGWAAFAVALATGIRFAAEEWLADPALLFLAAVSLVAWRAGTSPGVFAVALSALVQARYFIAPGAFLLATAQQFVALTIWSAEGILVCVIFGLLRAGQKRAVADAALIAEKQALLLDRESRLREAHDDLERRVALRTSELANANADLRHEAVEREHMESQLRHAQKMDAIGRLAGGVAHDFNNVLSVIITLAEMQLEDQEPETPLHQDLGEILKASHRAAALTRQLLTFSRQQAPEPKILNLYDVVADLGEMLRHLVGETIALTLPPARSAGNVRVDPGSIGQVVMNLVVNARDAMPTGGTLTLEIADVVLDSAHVRAHLDAKAGPHVMLLVADTGHGMSRATQARVFEPFFTTKERGKGTGFGLATVFGIVQQAGGSLSLSSEEGIGTTFRLYLPRVDGPLDNTRPSEAPVNLRGTETILLVEDEPQLRAAARTILTRYGYDVLDAGDGDEALDLCSRYAGTIHAVLTDMVMPRMDGFDLATNLRAARPDTRILCMSGYNDAMEKAGADVAFIQKPFEPKGLARKLREVLDAGRLDGRRTSYEP